MLRHLGELGPVHLACFADERGRRRAARPRCARRWAAASARRMSSRRGNDALDAALRALWRREPSSLPPVRQPCDARFRRAHRSPSGRSDGLTSSPARWRNIVPDGAAARFVMDFVDVDSAKFADYARARPLADWLVYTREAPAAARSRTRPPRAPMSACSSARPRRPCSATAARRADADIRALSERHRPRFLRSRAPSFAALEPAPPAPLIVFTGQMDYRPNVEP